MNIVYTCSTVTSNLDRTFAALHFTPSIVTFQDSQSKYIVFCLHHMFYVSVIRDPF